MAKLRWGVIGAGGIADRRTIPGIIAAENAELVALMEVNQELAEHLKNKWEAKRAYSTVEALLQDPEVDAVYIASPVVYHADQVRKAADAGKHILVEKPVAITALEAEELINYCKERQIQIAAGFMMRFGSQIQNMKKGIEEKKIGNIVSAFIQFTCWYPNMEDSWRQQKKLGGGGALMDMGVHCIDLLQYVTGLSVEEVVAFNDTLTFSYEVEDSSTLLLKMDNGAQFVVKANFNIPDQASRWNLEIYGDQGNLIGYNVLGQEDGGNLDAVFAGLPKDYNPTQNTSTAETVEISAEYGNLFEREIVSFSNSIMNQQPLEIPAEEAVRVQKIIEAAYESSKDKKFVKIS